MLNQNFVYNAFLICLIFFAISYLVATNNDYDRHVPMVEQYINKEITQLGGAPKPKLMLFYTDWCGACKQLRTNGEDESKYKQGNPPRDSEWGKAFHQLKKSKEILINLISQMSDQKYSR